VNDQWEIKPEYKEMFLEESHEQLQEWENCLLNLEKNLSNRELVDTLFRAIHTIKGSAGFVGFDSLQKITHDIESSIQDVRDGKIELTLKSVDILFAGLDIAQKMIDAFSEGKSFEGDIENFLIRLNTAQGVSEKQSNIEVTEETLLNEEKIIQEKKRKDKTDIEKDLYQIEIVIDASAKSESYLRSVLIQRRLSEVGKIISIDPAPEDLKENDEDFKFQVLISTEESIESLKKAANIDLVEIIKIEKRENKKEPVKEEEVVSSSNKSGLETRFTKSEEVVRVAVEKLDVILNLVGELVVQNSGFISITSRLEETYGKKPLILDLEGKTESLIKIARDLQDGVMSIRMVPIANIFNRFNRVVRDLAKARKKDIFFEVYGEETEIDKKIIDRIGEPLIHLIRNAVDHGIESKAERMAFGKNPKGVVKIGAYEEGDHICVEVSDDGRGIDEKSIIRKAVEKGIIKKGELENMSKEDRLNLIFLPGFSTKDEVSDVSGRGVGLDVVRRVVEDMGGVVRIKSESGLGTTATITLPLTMAIIPAILVEASQTVYAVPLSSVREIVKVKESTLDTIGKSRVIRLRDEVISMVYLSEALGLSDGYSNKDNDSLVPVVIVDYGKKKIGIGVDKTIGKEEIVIKSISKHYKEIKGLIGASVLGNGKIALIIDVEAMIRRYYKDFKEDSSSLNDIKFDYQSLHNHLDDKKAQSFKYSEEIEGKTINTEINLEKEDSINIQDELKNKSEERKETEDNQMFKLEKNNELFEEINNSGAVSASMAISQLTGKNIMVSFPDTKILPLDNIADSLGGEEAYVVGIYIEMRNNLTGGVLLVLPMKQALNLCDFLYKKPSETTKEIGEQELSGLTEMGNIISASFINAMGNMTNLIVNTEVPEVAMDMCQSVIDSILARFNQPGDRILLTEALIMSSDMDQIVCNLLMFLDPESINKMKDALTDN